MSGFSWFTPEASTGAFQVDALFWALMALSFGFAVPICLAIVFFAVRYRHTNDVNRKSPPQSDWRLEALWSLVPLGLGVFFFAWAAALYVRNSRPPANAMQIYVVGKQWMWKLQHPEGRREIDELHVPAGRPITLIMTSEDVIHDFFIPAFRVKQDVLPGRYTTLWFTPTRPGKYRLLCAEYCGTNHSRMGGWVYVQKPEDYQRWLRASAATPMETRGAQLFRTSGCSGCHGDNSRVRAPLLDNIYGRPVAIQTPGGGTTTITADERYLRDSILTPQREIAAGYPPQMPSHAGQLSEEEVLQIVAYLKAARPALNQGFREPARANSGKNAGASAYHYPRSAFGSGKSSP